MVSKAGFRAVGNPAVDRRNLHAAEYAALAGSRPFRQREHPARHERWRHAVLHRDPLGRCRPDRKSRLQQRGERMIPTVINPLGIDYRQPLTLTALSANSSVKLTATGSPTVSGLKYRTWSVNRYSLLFYYSKQSYLDLERPDHEANQAFKRAAR